MRPSISVAIAGLIWLTTYVSAQPNKEVYQLQERCGKRAAEVFEREYGSPLLNDKDGQTLLNYENHYSAGLNKCFSFWKSPCRMNGKGKTWLQNYATVRSQRQQGVRDLCEWSY
jgi:hypothetical protein